MKKKLLALLLSGAMILSLTTPVALAEEPEGESCGSCGQVECVCPPEEAPCEVCGEIECECEKIEELPEEEVPGAAAPEIPEEPTACEVCGEVECVCEKAEEPEVPEVPEEPTACEVCGEVKCICEGVNDYAELYEALMAAETFEDVKAIVGDITEDDADAFFAALDEEERALLAEHLEKLFAAEHPAKEGQTTSKDSEIVYPTVSNTDVAPFGDPVVGTPIRRLFASRAVTTVQEETDNGLELNKSVSAPDANGVYTLTLDSYVTGEKIITEVTEATPTDIILVLDQSGSMAYDFTITNYEEFNKTNPEDYYRQAQDSLYVQLPDGAYSSVAVKKTLELTSPQSYAGKSNSTYHDNSGKFYHKCADGSYGVVTCEYYGFVIGSFYLYTCDHCGETSSGLRAIFIGDISKPDNNNEFYTASSATTTYTFSYVDENGQTVTYGPATDVPDWQFYVAGESTESTRLAALKTAVTTFANNVKAKATADQVDHTIAIVGFASASGNGNNSEILTLDGENSGSVGVSYAELTSDNDNYEGALQDMSTTSGQTMVSNAISALAAEGATRVDLGMEMANKIFEKNPIPSGETRNRVIVVFTDGVPTTSNSYSSTVATNAINYSNTAKTTYGATVYSVGIFDGADSTKDGNANGGETEKANWFMHRLSSNTSYPQTPSYYLTAADSSALNLIFKSISQNIESGGSSSTLSETAVVKDVITDQFVLPSGTDTSQIMVYTADCTGKDADGNLTFGGKVAFTDATVAIDGQTVTVTNFNFSENWCGTVNTSGGETPHGKKLLIEIPIKVRDGFLGGNGVLTNADGSGVYENVFADEAIEEFDSPAVNVEIKEITIGAPNYNVYLTNGVSSETLIAGLTVQSGNVVLDMDADNYGLASWQYAYVDIADQDPSSTAGLADATYTATVTITPSNDPVAGTPGTVATTKSKTGSGNIYVYKPVITFKDSAIDLGETANYDNDNFVSVVWMHGTTAANNMTGDEPALAYNYSPKAGAFTEDTPVQVKVSIGDTDVTSYTTFKRNACTIKDDCHTAETTVDTSGETWVNFIVHINAFDLEIIKAIADGKKPDQNFVFEITGPSGFSMTVVIPVEEFNSNGTASITVEKVPAGTYTIKELTDWSWRYTCNDAEQEVSPSNPSATFINQRTDNQWLDGETRCQNVFQKTETAFVVNNNVVWKKDEENA